MWKMIVVLLLIIVTQSCYTPNLNITEFESQRLRNLILSLENDPDIKGENNERSQELFISMVNQRYFKWFMELPVPFDTSYHEVSLLTGYMGGIFLYVLDNWKTFKIDRRSNREFNIRAYMRGIIGMIRYYQGGVRKLGNSAKNNTMEDLIAKVNAGGLPEIAVQFVDDKIKKRDYGIIIVLIP